MGGIFPHPSRQRHFQLIFHDIGHACRSNEYALPFDRDKSSDQVGALLNREAGSIYTGDAAEPRQLVEVSVANRPVILARLPDCLKMGS